MAEPTSRGWRLDRTLSIAVIAMLLSNFGLGIWWASATESRLSALESRVARYETTSDTAAQRLGAIEQRLGCVQTDVSWIKRALGAAK
ncbi:MAG: hypothetical protein AB7D47_13135 [Desulfovibrio sp.]